MNHIAVLLTCHNRREQTLACLRALSAQRTSVRFSVYLTDDASTDYTAEAVHAAFPHVSILPGDGALYWNRGMLRAWQAAAATDADAYLWLNDDTLLAPDALVRLASLAAPDTIVAGATRSPDAATTTYGGLRMRRASLSFRLIEPAATPISCDTFNGNCVLIPRTVTQHIGLLDPVFHHALGDIDYGLRARRENISILLAPGHIGTCPRSVSGAAWRNAALPLRTRLSLMTAPKGLPPQQWLHFARRHAPLTWPLRFAGPYVKVLVQSLSGKPFFARGHACPAS